MIINRKYYNSYIIINISPEVNEIKHSSNMISNSLTTKNKKNNASQTKSDIFKKVQKLVTKRIKTYENSKSGYILEENIRELLKVKFNYKESKIPRTFFFRKIFRKNGGSFIIKKDVECLIKSKVKIKFKYKEEDKSCHLINSDNNEILLKISENEKNTKLKELGMTISSVKNIEMDGIFFLDKFIMPNFNTSEVKLIYNDIKIDANEQNKIYVILK